MAGLNQSPFASRIIGTGSAFPKKKLSNHELAKRVETSHEWIVERTGIHERRICTPGDPDEFNSSLGYKAAMQALEMANKKPEDIDQILYATCTPDTLIPSTACWVQQKLGAHRAFAVDLNAACSGFVFGLSTADQFIQTGHIKTSLVIGADVLSAFANWTDRSSCILFGDGAGAVVLEQTSSDSNQKILSSHLRTDGTLWDLFHVQSGGSKMETTPDAYEKKLNKMEMKGKEMFKEAVRTLSEFSMEALEKNNLQLSDLDWFIPHQANFRIIEAVAKRLKLPIEKVLINISEYGNTSSATVPTALDQAVRAGKIKPGQTILTSVFGAGLTYGSLLMRW